MDLFKLLQENMSDNFRSPIESPQELDNLNCLVSL